MYLAIYIHFRQTDFQTVYSNLQILVHFQSIKDNGFNFTLKVMFINGLLSLACAALIMRIEGPSQTERLRFKVRKCPKMSGNGHKGQKSETFK